MIVGFLGQPCRVVYSSQNFVSGLTQIKAKIIRPDFTIEGTFPLTEFTDPFLAGVYYFDYLTNSSYPVGEYIGLISNQEQGHKEGFRISYSVGQILQETHEENSHFAGHI